MDKQTFKNLVQEILTEAVVPARKLVRAVTFVPLLHAVLNEETRSSVVADAERRLRAITKDKEPLKTCPSCGIAVYYEGEVAYSFGYRSMKSGKTGRITTTQSHCRTCRSAKAKKAS